MNKRTSYFGTVVDQQDEEDLDFDSDFEDEISSDHPLYGSKSFKKHNFFGKKILESNICFGQHWEVEGEEVLKKYEGISIIQEVKEKFFLYRGTLFITNFQIYFLKEKQEKEEKSLFEKLQKTQFSLPLTKILQIDEKFSKEVNKVNHNGFRIISKDYFYYDFLFMTDVQPAVEFLKTLIFGKEITKTFSYEYKRYTSLFTPTEIANGWNIYKVREEFERQKIPSSKWKFSYLNENFDICSSYPRCLVVPNINDDIIIASAKYRSKGRLPVLSWCHPFHQTPIVRCAQPNAGLGFSRSKEDEILIDICRQTNEYSTIITIIDCRPKVNAVANSLKGKGYENTDNYKNCKIEFMNIENIHSISDSFQKLAKIWNSNQISLSDSSDWLQHISLILKASIRTSILIEKRIPVLLHCSDGWDRTSQVSAIAQLLLDPYYRTIKGFEVLIEKEWISFGHRFKDRCGHVKKSSEMSPIFLQFIDCVFQITKQFPNYFEFNDVFLLFILEQSYSCLFESSIKLKYEYTISIWTYVNSKLDQFRNPLFDSKLTKFITPNVHLNQLSTNTWTILNLYLFSKDNPSLLFSNLFSKTSKKLSEMHHYKNEDLKYKNILNKQLKGMESKIKDFLNKNEEMNEGDVKSLLLNLLESTKKLTILNIETIENDIIYYFIDKVEIKTFDSEIPPTSAVIMKTIEKFKFFQKDSNLFLQRIYESMRIKIEKTKPDHCFFWVSVFIGLINIMDFEFKEFSTELEQDNFFNFKKNLETLLYISYSKILISAYQSLSNILIPSLFGDEVEIIELNGESKMVDTNDILNVLTKYHNLCEEFKIFKEISSQFFSNIFQFMDVYVLNLMLKTSKYCKMSYSMPMKMHIAEVDNWSNSYKYPFKLELISQISKVLMLNKGDIIKTKQEICPDLSPPQLAKILTNYQPDEMDMEGISKELINEISTNEVNITDEYKRYIPQLSKSIEIPNWRKNIELPIECQESEDFEYLTVENE
eukprot:gene3241-5684_t